MHLRTHGYTWGALGAHLGHTWGTLDHWIFIQCCTLSAFEEKTTAVCVAYGITKMSNEKSEFSGGDGDTEFLDADKSEVKMTKKIRRPLSMDKAAGNRGSF